ncbi:hypothetical protein CIHG_00098 [Coccidioides immitis H538.4]|uniref:Uncharacterized protein n=2 Tax=Coccidioides immitis TaxID=5501 RepID=A0A0J8R121_COCIT|nr:hypothetical protein CISG_06787 [Coccidioides immitis RMSCC 3703]KMU82314.1 hypothetical protein CIHG_00098 [Coccidioides immitis H538.4]
MLLLSRWLRIPVRTSYCLSLCLRSMLGSNSRYPQRGYRTNMRCGYQTKSKCG